MNQSTKECFFKRKFLIIVGRIMEKPDCVGRYVRLTLISDESNDVFR